MPEPLCPVEGNNMKETAGAYPCRLVVVGDIFLLEWFLVGISEPSFIGELREKKQLLHVGGRTFTTLSALENVLSTRGVLKPALFIYHTTRSGSTLLARMLGIHDENLVFNEPSSVIKLLINCQFRDDHSMINARIRNLIGAFGLGARMTQRNLVFKFNSLCSFYSDNVRNAFPETPSVFIYRDPVEIMVGLVTEPAGWLYDDDEIFTRFLPVSKEEAAKCSIEQLSCMYLEQQFQWALARAGNFARFVNYSELPEAAFEIAEDFLQNRIREKSASILPWNAKQPYRPFVPDSRKKRDMASTLIRDLAETRLYPLYRKLEAIRSAKLLR